MTKLLPGGELLFGRRVWQVVSITDGTGVVHAVDGLMRRVHIYQTLALLSIVADNIRNIYLHIIFFALQVLDAHFVIVLL